MNKQKTILFSLAAVCLTVPTYAQPKLPVKGGPALKKNVIRTLVHNEKIYHPVFGYTQPFTLYTSQEPIMALRAPSSYKAIDTRLIQTAPVLRTDTETGYLKSFTRADDLSVPQLTEAIYLHRLANPTANFPAHQTDGSAYYANFLTEKANRVLNSTSQTGILQTEELPSVQLLEKLRKPYFVANTYTELAALYRKSYPKHVTLNADGIPVYTPLAETATLLDRFLMLSNPNELRLFNNTAQGGQYTPFVLTKEEHRAAKQLLSDRAATQRIPADATPRDLIEIAYNRLESHTVPYTQAETAGPNYKAYPNYKNSRLYYAIKEKIDGQKPIVVPERPCFASLENEDITHLIILDAVMGGVELTDWKNINRAIDAFTEFAAELEKTPENIAHVQVLQQNLRIVFYPLIEHARTLTDISVPRDYYEWKALSYLESYRPEELVGRNGDPYARFPEIY